MTSKELLEYLKSDECTSLNYVETLNKTDLRTEGLTYVPIIDTLFVCIDNVTKVAISAVKGIQDHFKTESDSYLYTTTTVYKNEGRTVLNFPLCYGMKNEEDYSGLDVKLEFVESMRKFLKPYLSKIYSIKYTLHEDYEDDLIYILLTVTLTNGTEQGFSSKKLAELLLYKILCSNFFKTSLPIKYRDNNYYNRYRTTVS